MTAPPKAGIKEGPIMPIRTLAEAISHYGRDAYLLTFAKDGPHTSNVTIELRGNSVGCNLGASAAKNIAREPNVSLFWPPTEPGGYALIVNGTDGCVGADGQGKAPRDEGRVHGSPRTRQARGGLGGLPAIAAGCDRSGGKRGAVVEGRHCCVEPPLAAGSAV
jgi:hypothetical protein